ncbi:TPA: shikimate dehydrogenase [Candidatus Bathyarchaeota archaeon]|nr:shikimate dehydrogenase [Candidatus Bathyarchaeota archaeon]
MDGRTGLLCLIGDPVEHSLSPMMHNLSFKKLGLNYVYVAFRVSRRVLGTVVAGLKAIGVKGFNVTTPLKRDVVGFLDRLSPKASRIGAVNTVLNDRGELIGFNTDGTGAVKALEDRGFKLEGARVLLLGAGNAGRAIAYALMDKPCRLTILNRTVEKAEVLAREVSGGLAEVYWAPLTPDNLARHVPRADILINATSMGMKPLNGETPVPGSLLRRDMVVFDIVYNPLETRLLREAKGAGVETLDGLEMLLHQGVEAFKIWFGLNPPVEDLKRAFEEIRRMRLCRSARP